MRNGNVEAESGIQNANYSSHKEKAKEKGRVGIFGEYLCEEAWD